MSEMHLETIPGEFHTETLEQKFGTWAVPQNSFLLLSNKLIL